MMADAFRSFVGHEVVIDTHSSYIYIGMLVGVTDFTLDLRDVDVHDRSESTTTKEKYVMEARKYGVKKNRKGVTVRLDMVVSISNLEDIIEY